MNEACRHTWHNIHLPPMNPTPYPPITPSSHPPTYTQIFNMINARKLHDELNVFAGSTQGSLFWSLIALMIFCQLIIVQALAPAFKILPQSPSQWMLAVVLGAASLLVSLVVKVVSRQVWVKAAWSWLMDKVCCPDSCSMLHSTGAYYCIILYHSTSTCLQQMRNWCEISRVLFDGPQTLHHCLLFKHRHLCKHLHLHLHHHCIQVSSLGNAFLWVQRGRWQPLKDAPGASQQIGQRTSQQAFLDAIPAAQPLPVSHGGAVRTLQHSKSTLSQVCP